MDVVRYIFLAVHMVGLVGLLAGWALQIRPSLRRAGRMSTPMLHGSLTQLGSGIVLTAIAVAGDGVIEAKIAVKVAITLMIVGLVLAYRRRADPGVPSAAIHAVGLLTLVNAAIASMWT